MKIETETHEGVLALTINAERVDAASTVQLKNQFREATEDWQDRVIIDLHRVQFIDSSGLGAMVALLKLLKGQKLELASLTPTVSKVFDLTRMDKVFEIHGDLHTALNGPATGLNKKAV